MRPAPPRIRAAIAGLGRIAWLLEDDRLREKPATHAGALAANPDCLLVAGCDPSPERREAFGARYAAEVYADLDSLLAAGRPDLLVVSSPPEDHLSLVESAVGAKVPLVVCEKPLAPRAAEARRIVALCEEGGTELIVNFERRYARDWLEARSVVEAGNYGPLLSAAATVFMGRTRAAASVLVDDGVHMLDCVRMLCGEIEPGLVARGEVDSPGGTLVAILRAGGVPLALTLGGGRDHLVFELRLDFASGRLRVGNGVHEAWESVASPHYEGFRSLRRLPEAPHVPSGYFSGMIADAVAVLRSGSLPRSTGRNGLRTLEIAEEILEACRSGDPGPAGRDAATRR